MVTNYRAGEVRRSLQRFNDFASDLLASDYNTFEDRLNLLISFCEADAVFANIHQQLMNFPTVDFDAWIKDRFATMGGMSGSGELSFPTDLEARMAVMYQLLVAVRDTRVPWMQFGITFFATASTQCDEYIYAFNEAITRPLVRELSYRLGDMEEPFLLTSLHPWQLRPFKSFTTPRMLFNKARREAGSFNTRRSNQSQRLPHCFWSCAKLCPWSVRLQNPRLTLQISSTWQTKNFRRRSRVDRNLRHCSRRYP